MQSLNAYRHGMSEALAERRLQAPPVIAPFVALVLLFAVFIIAVGLYIAPDHRPDRHFDEQGLVTYASALFMAATSGFAFLCFLLRMPARDRGRWLWLLIWLGFLYFSVDEVLEFHERLDWTIAESPIGPAETFRNWNDVVVISYGLVGALVMLSFLPEILRYRRVPELLGLGFGCYALHTLIDSVVVNDTPTSRMIEESAKLFSGAFFSLAVFAALLAIYQRRRAMSAKAPPESPAGTP